MTTSNGTPPTLPLPTETLVVGQDGEVLLVLEGTLVLPIGARVQVDSGGPEAAVVGVRLVRTDAGAPQLLLEVDAGGSSFSAAILEADAEAQVIQAAEDITAAPADALGAPTPDPVAET